MSKFSVLSPLLLALLIAVAIIIESNFASGHGSGGYGRGGSGGSFGGNGGHAGSSSQGGGGASNTIPRRDGYGVTVSR